MWEQIRANKRRSLVLIAAMFLVLISLGVVVGGAVAPEGLWVGGGIAFLIFLVLWLIAVGGGSKLVLASAGAREIQHADVPRLFNVVEEMSIAAALPKPPKVYLIDCEAPNAFACGSPDNSAVAVTTGLLARLNRDELQGVVAHEIAHVKNEDTKFMTLAGVMMGAIILIADGVVRTVFYTGGRRRSSRSSSGGGQAQAILMIVAIVFAILAPILSQMLYFACSRRREYLADASAARFTRYPEGLASALEKISGGCAKMKDVNRVTAPMYIINPLQAAHGAAGLFTTHPPSIERVKILRSMAGGAGLGNYENAFRKVHGDGLVGAQSLDSADRVDVRAPSDEPETTDLHKAREAVDVLHRMGGFLFLNCACGLTMKVPPTFEGDKVKCPRCKVESMIPRAAAAAAAGAVLAAEMGEEQKLPRAQRAPMAYRMKPGQWNSFRCECGKTIQLSPAFAAARIACNACGRETAITR